MKLSLPHSPAARQAVLIATVMMAWQVAAKATRDSLFLAVFEPEHLPRANVAAAFCAIVLALACARLMRRLGPSRLIPAAYLLGAILHVAEWSLIGAYPRAVTAFTYVHIIALGPVMLSGFWALASERFDPREARRRFGQITAFGTIGAILGPLAADRIALFSSTNELLIFLAALQLFCFAALLAFAPGRRQEAPQNAPSFPDIISGAPYLLRLAGFVLLISMSAAMLDYAFKVQVKAQYSQAQELTRFFLLFNAITAAVTFAAQAALSGLWLKRFGPGRTVATLPLAVTGASIASLAFPGFTLIISRAIEQLLRGSLYRSGYELFYTPMPAAEKRSTKPAIDIGADRSGDLLANAGIQLLLTLPAAASFRAVLSLTALFAGAAAWLALRLDKAYVSVLEKGLVQQTVTVAPEEAEDLITKSVVLKSLATMTALTAGGGESKPSLPADPLLLRLAELRSTDPLRVRAALHTKDQLPPLLVPQVIELLGRDEVARPAHEALVKSARHIAGQLSDYLADPANPEKIRRRIPRILASSGCRAGFNGLLAQISDDRFEIRLRCARGLEKMLERNAEFRPPDAMIFEAVGRELSSRERLSNLTGGGGQNGAEAAGGPEAADGLEAVDEVLRERAAQRLNLLSTLLGLILPAQSVRLAFRALQTQDVKLRGVALEYLDSVLPDPLRAQVARQFEGAGRTRQATAPRSQEALANLMDSSPSIMARLEELGFDPAKGRED